MGRKAGQFCEDVELNSHMEDLDRYHLRATEWKTSPIQQPKHDFVTALLEEYLNDLKKRKVRD
jgi:hypothetical protein